MRKTVIMQNLSKQDLARFFDHTCLRPEATRDDILRLGDEAKQYGFYSVCVNPIYVKACAEILVGSDVRVCTVVGFPLGASTTETKITEAANAIENGAHEIDMVMNIGFFKSKNFTVVQNDIQSVVRVNEKIPVKVILETCLLTDDEKILACKIAQDAGAAFVKTSTGFNKGGATVHDVVLMRKTVGDTMGVKASGGVRTLEDALSLIDAGASRIGASASVGIITPAPHPVS